MVTGTLKFKQLQRLELPTVKFGTGRREPYQNPDKDFQIPDIDRLNPHYPRSRSFPLQNLKPDENQYFNWRSLPVPH